MSKKLFFTAIQNYKVNNKKDTYAHSMYYCRERERECASLLELKSIVHSFMFLKILNSIH